MQTRFSLNPEDRAGDEAKHWATFSDVALSMLLVFLLFILAQFLNYERIFVLEEIARRKAEVESRVTTVARRRGIDVAVLSEDDLHQRIRVTGELVFEACRDQLTADGRSLLEDLGTALRESQSFFEAIQVEGHADRELATGEICRRAGIQDNWQLSARRATEVVRLFSAGGYLSDAALSSVGRGEFHPLSDPSDTTSAALRRDRRIEIVLRYTDEGIGSGGGGG